MEAYNEQHRLERERCYDSDDDYSDEDSDYEVKKVIAKFIRDKFDSLSEDEMRKIVIRCMSLKKVKSELLKFELKHYEQETNKNINLQEFAAIAEKILNRYQGVAGGFKVEDFEWTQVERKTQYLGNNFEVKKNEIVFLNSIDKLDKNDNELSLYLKRIVEYLDNISNKVDVRHVIKESPKDGLYWILIRCKYDDSEESSEIEIDL